ncbi:uncharacterized protein CCOS01_06169 [Colletotrichum costaricense]|uniref:Uncharacterized protein n=1 Tax=Colletotrichum costaricense TaxID=1209916 RepID=A0AAI9Z348_9PEZI|nr:uncharacterized protein CCOS01_06169 [Colletotrichum costaricense]KAK1531066.1 hypothetical protein CCOS01_06169 [Colletotrichum costaricense]
MHSSTVVTKEFAPSPVSRCLRLATSQNQIPAVGRSMGSTTQHACGQFRTSAIISLSGHTNPLLKDCTTQTEGSNNIDDLSALRAYQSALRSFICTAWRGGNRALSTSHGVLNLQPSGLDSEPTSTTRIQFGHSPRFSSCGHEMTLFSLRNHGKRSRNRIRLQPSITSFRPSNARTRRTRDWLLDERCFSAVTPNPGSVYSPLRRASAFFQRGCPDCMVGEPVSAARLGHSPLRRWLVERYRQPSAIPTTGNQRFHTVFHFPLRPPLQRTFALQMGYYL